MRILILTHAYSVHIERWLDGLRRRGHAVRALVREPAKAPDVIAPPAALARIAPLRQAWLATSFVSLLREFKPEMLHQHWFEVPRLSRLFPPALPLVISTWGADIIREWPAPELTAARQYATRAACVLGSSQFLADEAARVLDRPVERLYWGVDLRRFTPQPRPTHGFTVGFLKHLLPKYAPDVALVAFARVHAAMPDARLHFYGEGPMRERLIAQSRVLGVEDAVVFFGRIPYAQVPAALATFDVMVMPSRDRSETLGVAALEAQAMGVPVVASRIGGIPEAVRDGVGGLLVPPEDAQALADALLRLGRDPALRARLGTAGRAFVEEQFDWEVTLEGMNAIFERALAVAESGITHG